MIFSLVKDHFLSGDSSWVVGDLLNVDSHGVSLLRAIPNVVYASHPVPILVILVFTKTVISYKSPFFIKKVYSVPNKSTPTLNLYNVPLSLDVSKN